MVQKSGMHHLRLVVHPIIYRFFFTSQAVVWDFFHQQHVGQSFPTLALHSEYQPKMDVYVC